MSVAHTLPVRRRRDQVLLGSMSVGSLLKRQFWVAIFLAVSAHSCLAQTCYPPQRPFIPNDPSSVKEYGNIIKDDLERYIQEIQSYFRCLDAERARAFVEARETSDDYRRVLEILGD